MREPMHVVNLGRQQKFSDVGEHGVRHHRAAGVFQRIDGRRHAAGEKPFDDLDEIDHRIADMAVAVGIETIGLDHQRAGADQQIAEACARADTGMAMVRGIAGGQETGFLGLAVREHTIPRHEHVVELHDTGRLAVFRRILRRRFSGPAGGPSNDRDARRIDGHGATHGECGILRRHRATGHHEKFVHVGRARHDRLGTPNDDPVRPPLGDVHVDIAVRLRAGPFGAVPLGVRHGDAERQVFVLHLVHISEQAVVIAHAAVGIDALRRLIGRVEAIVREVALRAPRLATHQAHRLELEQQVLRSLIDVQHPVDGLAGRPLPRRHQRRAFRLERKIVGYARGPDARRQLRRVRDTVDPAPIDEHPRPITAQAVAVVRSGHQHRVVSSS